LGEPVSRRAFLRCAGQAGGLALCGGVVGGVCGLARPAAAADLVKAEYWKPAADNVIRCTLCPRGCVVARDERGFCGARCNLDGAYYTMVYGKVAAKKLDAIEKDPLYHFHPGTKTLAVATAGCNLDCSFCQSWQMAQSRPEDVPSESLTPAQVADAAVAAGCQGICFTYTEPINFIEYACAIAEEAHSRGLYAVCHTAGYVNPGPLKDLCRAMDAFAVDLKGSSEEFYREHCGNAKLQPVLDTIQAIHQSGKHLEIVTLVLPGLNDTPEGIVLMANWIASALGPDVPYHLTKFFPEYKLKNLQATANAKLEEVRGAVYQQSPLRYVYIGNVPGHGGQSTYCPTCNARVVWRVGYTVREIALRNGRCPCGTRVKGVW